MTCDWHEVRPCNSHQTPRTAGTCAAAPLPKLPPWRYVQIDVTQMSRGAATIVGPTFDCQMDRIRTSTKNIHTHIKCANLAKSEILNFKLRFESRGLMLFYTFSCTALWCPPTDKHSSVKKIPKWKPIPATNPFVEGNVAEQSLLGTCTDWGRTELSLYLERMLKSVGSNGLAFYLGELHVF